jgi:hypothetical protein
MPQFSLRSLLGLVFVCSVAAAISIRLGAPAGWVLSLAFFGGLCATVLVDVVARTPLSGIAAAVGGMIGGFAAEVSFDYTAQPYFVALEIAFGLAAWLLYVDVEYLRWRRAMAQAGEVASPTHYAWHPKSFLAVAVIVLVAGPFLGIVAFVIGTFVGVDDHSLGVLGRIVFLGTFGGTLIGVAYFLASLLVRPSKS